MGLFWTMTSAKMINARYSKRNAIKGVKMVITIENCVFYLKGLGSNAHYVLNPITNQARCFTYLNIYSRIGQMPMALVHSQASNLTCRDCSVQYTMMNRKIHVTMHQAVIGLLVIFIFL